MNIFHDGAGWLVFLKMFGTWIMLLWNILQCKYKNGREKLLHHCDIL